MAEKPNGMDGEVTGEYADESFNGSSGGPHRREKKRETLYGVIHRLITSIIFPEPDNAAPILNRIKISVSENVPLIPEASRNTGRDVLLWTRRGSPLRALLVISVGTITCVALTGLLVFAPFFLAATINAIVISLLMSLAVAGGFLALFFAFVTAIYIGALSVAIFTISIITFWTIVAILITTGNKLFDHLALFIGQILYFVHLICYGMIIEIFTKCWNYKMQLLQLCQKHMFLGPDVVLIRILNNE